jgi:hypothetical protein
VLSGFLSQISFFWPKADRSLLHHGPKVFDIDVCEIDGLMLTEKREIFIRNSVSISSTLALAAVLPFKGVVEHINAYLALSLYFT